LSHQTNDRLLRVIAAAGLAVGGILGMAGTFAPTDALRGLAWGIDGTSLVVASALLAVHFYRLGHDLVAAGYIVFAVGEGLLLSGAAMDLAASGSSFGAGVSLWAAGLLLISGPQVYPVLVRFLGFAAAVLFVATAVQIFCRVPLHPKSAPLPFFAYPVLVATLFGWIWALLRRRDAIVESLKR
jgi:hypothetical protein